MTIPPSPPAPVAAMTIPPSPPDPGGDGPGGDRPGGRGGDGGGPGGKGPGPGGAGPGSDAHWAVSGARAMGFARLVLGVTALAAPRLPLWPWVGRPAARARPVRMLARALGARDVALGLGLLLALRRGAPARGWVEAGGLADLGDAAVTLASFGSLPPRGRWAVLAAAGGGAVVAPVLARGLPGTSAER